MESNVFVQMFLVLGIIIGAAQVLGSLARMIGQPRVFGELIAGVILGPTLLDIFHWGFDDPHQLEIAVEEFAELGVLLLMFVVGLEVHLRELLSVGRVAIYGGVLGAALPVAMAIPAMLAFDYSTETGIAVGVVLAATSVSISAQTLLELGLLRTREGIGLLATAVVDDILAILLLSVVIATLGPNAEGASVLELVWIFVRMLLYLGGALLVAWFVLPPAFNWLHRQPRFSQGTASFALIAALLFGWSADALGGVAAITGAFIAGMGLSQTNNHVKDIIEETVQGLSYSFLVPIFFVNVGLRSDLTAMGLDLVPLSVVLVIISVVSKIAGSGLGARLGGFNNGESFRLGVCMISRGEVGLIVAALELSMGLLTETLFQPVFLVILLTTVLTPPMVRVVFRGKDDDPRGPRGAEQEQPHTQAASSGH